MELKRIRESGGNVLCKAGVHRVVWNRQKLITSTNYYRSEHLRATVEYEQIPFLAVSRALGDLWSLNKQTNLYSVSPEPELTVIEIDPNKHRCLILASDGLWNMITPEVAVEIVRNCDVKTEAMILNSEVWRFSFLFVLFLKTICKRMMMIAHFAIHHMNLYKKH